MDTTTPNGRARERRHRIGIRRIILAIMVLGMTFATQIAQPGGAQTGTAFQTAFIDDSALLDVNGDGTYEPSYITSPFEIPEPNPGGGRPGSGPIQGASMTAEMSNFALVPGENSPARGGTPDPLADDGLIGGDVLEFDVTITNTSDPASGAILTAFAFQSKASESPALASRIGDKLYAATLESGGADGQMTSVKKNGTSQGLFPGKWKGICINSSTDFLPEFNSGLEEESLECGGARTDANFDGEPELDISLGLSPGASQTVRLRLDSGTTDGALHQVEPGTLQGAVEGVPVVGPNGLTYFVPTIDNDGIATPNVTAIPDFADNKVLRDADGSFNPTFAPAADGFTFANQTYLTLPRVNYAFSDLLGRNHTCATYGLNAGACAGDPSPTPFISVLDVGDLVPGAQNLAAMLHGFGEEDDTIYGQPCERCGGRPYVPIAEFYVDNGDSTVTQMMASGSYGSLGTPAQYTATVSDATYNPENPGPLNRFKLEVFPEQDAGGAPARQRLETSATGEFSDLTVVPGGGINGGDAIEFNVTVRNTSTNPEAHLTAFNYQTKRRGLADIGVLDGFTQDRRDVRTDPSLSECTSPTQGACWDAALGVGRFPNVIGNGLLFGQMVWTNDDAGREGPVISDQVYVDPANGIDPTPFWLESVKKNGPFSSILKGNENFICIKSGLFDNDPDADAGCAGEPAELVDDGGEAIPGNISQRLGLPPGETQTARIRMEFGDFRGALLEILPGTLTLDNAAGDPADQGLRRIFDCSDQRELEYCHPEVVGQNIGYNPGTTATWLTPQTLEEIQYVIINQPGDAPTVMNFQQNFGRIMAMAGFRPTAEFYAPDTNPDLAGYCPEGSGSWCSLTSGGMANVLIRQQVIGTYGLQPGGATPAPVTSPTCNGAPVTVNLALGQTPTAGPDVILGTNAANTINGRGGDDVICGLGGPDIIEGGPGNDLILAGAGADTVRGEGGRDHLVGGDGGDTLQGGGDQDFLDGGVGADILDGGAEADTIIGGIGADTLDGGGGNDSLDGGDGADTVRGDAGNDVLDGGAGPDIMTGGAGDDTITGGPGVDSIDGGGGFDVCDGGPGGGAPIRCEAEPD